MIVVCFSTFIYTALTLLHLHRIVLFLYAGMVIILGMQNLCLQIIGIVVFQIVVKKCTMHGGRFLDFGSMFH